MPTRLNGAIDNSLAKWQDLLDLTEAHPHLWGSLASSELLAKSEGRPRMPGEWGIALLLYVNSAERELERWYRSTSDELWVRLGFAKTPGYTTVWKNFRQLEEHAEAFQGVAAQLTQIAVERSGGKVGHALHVDGTEAETHSRLVHDCSGDEFHTCKKQIKTPNRATNADARGERHRLAEEIPTDEDLFGATEQLAADDRGLRVLVNGCWYRLSDPEAGIRAYTRNGKLRKFWAGYYNAKAVDHYTGAVLAVHVTDASTQEHIGYVGLYEQIKRQLGGTPQAIVADRGYSVSSVFEAHTRDGVASVIPWRKHHNEPTRKDNLPKYDRHGIPHCKQCGGEGVFVRFQHDSGPYELPRLWFRCARPASDGCEKTQSLMCSENWRLLVPLWRTSPAYQVLRASHQSYEPAHHRWRERYAVGGDTKADRPKRRGLGVQQLRASAALVIEWLTVCHRQGWLPGGTAINAQTERKVSPTDANASTKRLVTARLALGLSEVDAEGMPAHQEAILGAYGPSSSSFGAASAHGSEITTLLLAEKSGREADTHDELGQTGAAAPVPGHGQVEVPSFASGETSPLATGDSWASVATALAGRPVHPRTGPSRGPRHRE